MRIQPIATSRIDHGGTGTSRCAPVVTHGSMRSRVEAANHQEASVPRASDADRSYRDHPMRFARCMADARLRSRDVAYRGERGVLGCDEVPGTNQVAEADALPARPE